MQEQGQRRLIRARAPRQRREGANHMYVMRRSARWNRKCTARTLRLLALAANVAAATHRSQPGSSRSHRDPARSYDDGAAATTTTPRPRTATVRDLRGSWTAAQGRRARRRACGQARVPRRRPRTRLAHADHGDPRFPGGCSRACSARVSDGCQRKAPEAISRKLPPARIAEDATRPRRSPRSGSSSTATTTISSPCCAAWCPSTRSPWRRPQRCTSSAR